MTDIVVHLLPPLVRSKSLTEQFSSLLFNHLNISLALITGPRQAQTPFWSRAKNGLHQRLGAGPADQWKQWQTAKPVVHRELYGRENKANESCASCTPAGNTAQETLGYSYVFTFCTDGVTWLPAKSFFWEQAERTNELALVSSRWKRGYK